MRFLLLPSICRMLLAWAVVATPLAASAAETSWPQWRPALIEKFTTELRDANAELEKKPTSQALLSRRGDLYLFLGAYPEAVADFEKMIALDPTQDAPHWRLGIAYYFNGQFAKSERQFEKYHAYDGHDRENGIWKFLAQEKVDGLEKARAEMLTYKEFDREPFPALYEMYAGRRTPGEVFAEIERKGLSKDPQVSFFGNYYTGLYELLQGHRGPALELLRKAVDILPGPDTVYMWNVARLHWERLVKEQAEGK